MRHLQDGVGDGDGDDGDVGHLLEVGVLDLLPVVCTGPQTSRGRDNFPSSKITSDSFKMIKKTV